MIVIRGQNMKKRHLTSVLGDFLPCAGLKVYFVFFLHKKCYWTTIFKYMTYKHLYSFVGNMMPKRYAFLNEIFFVWFYETFLTTLPKYILTCHTDNWTWIRWADVSKNGAWVVSLINTNKNLLYGVCVRTSGSQGNRTQLKDITSDCHTRHRDTG